MEGLFLVDKKKKPLQFEEIQDGDWGIFDSNSLLPIERYDPFSTYRDEKGLKIGHKTIFSPIRRKRPIEFESDKHQPDLAEKLQSASKDTFCKLISGEIPSIIITKDLGVENDPFSTSSINHDLHSSTAFSTINLYPPVSRVVKTKEPRVDDTNQYPTGLSLVHVFTKHYSLPEEIPVTVWQIFLHNYCLTIKSCINHPTLNQSKDSVIHSFFNIGPRAGASIPHLHGQSVLYINHSGSGSKFRSYSLASLNHKECLQCYYWSKDRKNIHLSPISIKDRIIAQNDHWMAFLAYAPEKDAHIRLLPHRHVSALWKLTEGEINSLAPILVKSNAMLSKFIEQEGSSFHLVKDRNIIIRQLMKPNNSHFHMFIDLLPVQQLGGLEILDNQKISSTLPESISHIMKSLI
ncbi:MAG: hypothetical protein ACW98F_01120 [Candidatus Hodarchaeales archaeon]|jgi:galactose-1-phosphate uridylyltransferase